MAEIDVQATSALCLRPITLDVQSAVALRYLIAKRRKDEYNEGCRSRTVLTVQGMLRQTLLEAAEDHGATILNDGGYLRVEIADSMKFIGRAAMYMAKQINEANGAADLTR